MPELQMDDLIQPQNIRKLVQKTVDTYPLDWKVVHEAFQNAKDAIQKAGRQGAIDIVLDVGGQSVRVADNGCGFPYNIELLGIGGTDKDEEVDWRINGSQGVGVKAVIFSTVWFRLESVHAGKRWEAWIDRASDYLQGLPVTIKITEPAETSNPTGTTVEYRFEGSPVVEFLNSVVNQHLPSVHEHLARDDLARIKLAIEFYFRAYTYAGDVNRLLNGQGIVPMVINVVIVATGEVPSTLHPALRDQLAKHSKVELSFENRHWDFSEAVQRTRAGAPKPTILQMVPPQAGRIGNYNENYVFAGKYTTEAEYQALLNNPNLRIPIDVSKYRQLFDNLAGIYVVIGARPVLLKYLMGPPRQFICASGVPSAHVLSGPTRGGEASYVANNIHFVINLKARLNYGKQTIANPWLVGQASRFFDEAVRATLKNVATAIVGFQGGTSSADDIEATGLVETNIIGRKDLAGDLLGFKKVPYDENALIAIFSELVGRGYLKGYNVYSLHQRAQYDGKATMKVASQPSAPVPQSDADLRNIEFKLQLRDLLVDFEEEQKNPMDISLAIVWSDALPTSFSSDYQVVDIEHTPDADRAMDGVAKCLHAMRRGRYIQLLVLEDFIAKLPQMPD